MRLRVALSWTIFVVAAVALSLVSGVVGSGRSERQRVEPNALLILRSVRDLRRPGAARFAEALGTDRVSLYLFGARVHVDVRETEMRLVRGDGSAIDTLAWVDRRRRIVRSGRWSEAGPAFGLYLRS